MNIENRFCSIAEYNYFQEERLQPLETELESNEVYLFMCRLHSKDPKKQAAKIPLLISEVTVLAIDNCHVKLTVPATTSSLEYRTEAAFQSGMWQRSQSKALWIANLAVDAGYFRDASEADEDAYIFENTRVLTGNVH